MDVGVILSYDSIGPTPIAGDPAAPEEQRRVLPKLSWVKETPRAKTPDRLNKTLGGLGNMRKKHEADISMVKTR